LIISGTGAIRVSIQSNSTMGEVTNSIVEVITIG